MARPPSCCQLREEEAEGEKKTFHNSTFPNVNRMGKKEREIVLLLHWFGSAAVQISLVVFWGDCRRAWKIGADSIVHSMWYSRFICRAFFIKKERKKAVAFFYYCLVYNIILQLKTSVKDCTELYAYHFPFKLTQSFSHGFFRRVFFAACNMFDKKLSNEMSLTPGL